VDVMIDSSRTEEPDAQAFAVYRQDDNGASTRIKTFATLGEAQEFLDALEARAHKQFYWIEPYDEN